MSDPLLLAEQVSKTYGTGRTAVHAVRGVDLRLEPGEIALVMGPSGSGKTTLLSMLGGLLEPTTGRVHLSGVDFYGVPRRRRPALRAQSLGFVFQAFNLLGALTAEQNVLFPAKLAGRVGAEQKERARSLLDRVGLADRRSFLPGDLSGGEQQRVALARALMNDPAVILADEPTGNLDSARGQEVLMMLHDLARDDGRGVLIVTHDPRAEDVADRILWLEDGELRDRRASDVQWVTDPICGMRVDAARAVAFVENSTGRVSFCTLRCKERYLERDAGEAVAGSG
jgi:putative ABC transport system ATP-binding protein